MTLDVTLTTEELLMCSTIATHRHIESVIAGRKDRHGAASAENRLGLHFEGACGEQALCKALDRHWPGSVNSFKGADVGRNVQVRTRSKHDWELIVRSDDSDLDWFILVTGTAPSYRIHGYIQGRAAKRPEWIRDHGGHGPAYFVPQAALRSFDGAKAAAA